MAVVFGPLKKEFTVKQRRDTVMQLSFYQNDETTKDWRRFTLGVLAKYNSF